MKSKRSAKNLVRAGQKYKHYKGGLYYVTSVGKHSETLEEMVVYVCLYDNPESQVWVRPLQMFGETVEYQGKTVTRFDLLDK